MMRSADSMTQNRIADQMHTGDSDLPDRHVLMIEMAWTLLPFARIEPESARECNRFSAPSTAGIRGRLPWQHFNRLEISSRVFSVGAGVVRETNEALGRVMARSFTILLGKPISMVYRGMSRLQSKMPIAICRTHGKNPPISFLKPLGAVLLAQQRPGAHRRIFQSR
jgi:hypothetical protein